MLRIFLALICLLTSSCTLTRTKQTTDSNDLPFVATQLAVNEAVGAFSEKQGPPADKFKRVFTKINGQIILPEKCFASNTPYIIELKRPQVTKADLFAKVNSEKLNYEIQGRTFDGDYELHLVNLRTSKPIEIKKLRVDSQHDQFTVNFNGCL